MPEPSHNTFVKDKEMKNKKPSQKPVKTKKEIKRPAHKKPRAKKYVEAKIPGLPPVPTNAIPITKETPCIDTLSNENKRIAPGASSNFDSIKSRMVEPKPAHSWFSGLLSWFDW